MINTDENWLNNQKLAIRPQGKVEIRINTGSGFVVFANDDIKNFRYTQSGKVDNSILPVREVYFETYGNKIDLVSVGNECELFFGFENTPLYSICLLKVAKKERLRNGLFSKLTLDDNNFWLPDLTSVKKETTYTKGSRFGNNTGLMTSKVFFNEIGGNSIDVEGNHDVGHTLGVCTYGEALQQLAITLGKTLYKEPRLWSKSFRLIDLEEATPNLSYYISSLIQYTKPEYETMTTYSNIVINGYDLYVSTGGGDITIPMTLNANETKRYYFDTNECYAVYVPSGTPNVSSHFEYNCCVMTNTSLSQNSFNLTQAPLNKIPFQYELPTGLVGLNLNVSSPLFTPYYQTYTSAFLSHWVINNQVIKVKCRIDPRIELFDMVCVDLGDTIGYGIAEYILIEFSGGFKGEIELRKVGNETMPLYLTNLSNENAVFHITFSNNLSPILYYKIDNGMWLSYTTSQTDISVPAGSTIFIKGDNPNGLSTDTTNYVSLFFDKKCKVGGNLMTLIEPTGETTEIPNNYCFYNLFQGATGIGEIDKNLLSATKLKDYCYNQTFANIGELTNIQLHDCLLEIPSEEIKGFAFRQCFTGAQSNTAITLDISKAKIIRAYGLDLGEYVNLLTTPLFYNFIFGVELATLESLYTTNRRLNLYFKHTNNDSVLFDPNNAITQATSNKSSTIVNVYTDNDVIANACAQKRNEYTTINLYYYDGTSRDVPQITKPVLTPIDNESMSISQDANVDKYEIVGVFDSPITITNNTFNLYNQIVKPDETYHTIYQQSKIIKVKAYGEGYFPSEYSDELSYLYIFINTLEIYGWLLLATPTISAGANNYTSWSAIPNATKYYVIVQGVNNINVFSTTQSNMLIVPFGRANEENRVDIVATNDTGVSERSNQLTLYKNSIFAVGSESPYTAFAFVVLPTATGVIDNNNIATITMPTGYESCKILLILGDYNSYTAQCFMVNSTTINLNDYGASLNTPLAVRIYRRNNDNTDEVSPLTILREL